MIIRKCKNCGKEFGTYNNEVKKGGGKFCSIICFNIYNRGENAGHYRGGKKSVNCLNCKKGFNVYPSTIVKNNNRFFCCKKCFYDFKKYETAHYSIICKGCGKKFYLVNGKKHKFLKFCSHQCAMNSEIVKNKISESTTGHKHWNWKGGRIESCGYISLYFPTHPNSDKHGYVRENRLVAANQLGRYLEKWEIVHHINEIKDDNLPENLYLFPNRKGHVKYHRNPHPLISNII